MKTTEFIKMSLENGNGWTLGLIGDMKNAPLTQPNPKGGNHPLWVLGHIVHSQSNLLDVFLLGKTNRFPELEESCCMGSTPSTNAGDYPSMDELLSKFEEVHSATLDHLAKLSDDDLDKKSHAPAERGPLFATVGAVLAAMASHRAFHTGQVADARRAAGRKPLMA